MASNQLIKISRNRESKPVSTSRLNEIEKTLDKLWSMFQTQVERNMELMAVIQKQQENSHKITFSLPEPQAAPPEKTFPATTTQDIPELGFEKLRRLETMLVPHIDVRTDALHSMINVFHYMYQFGGEAYPEQLMNLAGISSASFYRYLYRMRRAGIIRMKRGKAVMTETGKKIYNEELTSQFDIHKALYREVNHREPPEGLFNYLANAHA